MKRVPMLNERVSGVAKVEMKGDKVRITFRDTNEQFITKKSNCPDNIKVGIWGVTMSADGTKVYAIRPVKGIFTCRVSRFAAREGKPPVTKPDKYGTERFTVILEIVEGECTGMEVPLNLPYWFCPYETSDGKTIVAVEYHPRSSNMRILDDFITATGLDEISEKSAMPWKDNILPMLETRIKELNKQFKIVMKDGWVDTIIPSEQEQA